MTISTKDRLETVALELFSKKGYENTTASEIAEQAGVTERTFFRYFPEKKEILFGDSPLFVANINDAVRKTSDADGTVFERTFLAVQSATGEFFAERFEEVQKRSLIISDNAELKEREINKRMNLIDSIAKILVEQGENEGVANIVASNVMMIFSMAFQNWLQDDKPTSFDNKMAAAKVELLKVVDQF